MAQDAVRKIVVIGGSAGSLNVILNITPTLPGKSGSCFIIVVHRKTGADPILTNLLSSRTSMKVKEVEDKEPILPDRIYIAPADYHLLLDGKEIFSLDSSEKIHHSRPSIDVTFESAAETYKEDVVGILLSGANADGAEGLSMIKALGGVALVQDPATAEIGYMPQQAINKNAFTKILPPEQMGDFLNELLSLPKSGI